MHFWPEKAGASEFQTGFLITLFIILDGYRGSTPISTISAIQHANY